LLEGKKDEEILDLFGKIVKAMQSAEYKCAEWLKPFAPKEKKVAAKKTASKKK